jgi:hypothetical protein
MAERGGMAASVEENRRRGAGEIRSAHRDPEAVNSGAHPDGLSFDTPREVSPIAADWGSPQSFTPRQRRDTNRQFLHR